MHKITPLPYNYSDLEPHIDAKTMEIHYSKHHATYVANLNTALEGSNFADNPIDWLLTNLNQLPDDKKLVVKNNGGGHFNHELFWQLMTPESKPLGDGKLKSTIISTFGSVESLMEKMNDTGLKRFGSGWSWLVINDDKLEIMSTANQDCPITEGKVPLIGIDVWEHAYYLHYQNRRADYLKAWWNVVNWRKVEELFAKNT